MNKKITIAAAATLLLGYSAASTAGIKFTQTTTTDGKRVSVTRVSADGDKAKMEMVESPDNPFMPAGSYMLVQGSGDMYLVNPTARTYARFDTAMFADVAAAASGMASQFEIKDAKVEKLLDEPGESIEGYPTRHYRFQASWTMAMRGMPMSTTMNVEEEIWATTAIEVPSMNAGPGIALPAEVTALTERDFEGVPLRQISVQSTKTQMGGLGGGLVSRMANRAAGGAVTTTIEVSDIEETAVPADTFELPAGYSETSLMQSGPAIPNLNQLGGAAPPAVPNLNDLR
jgi:Tfp pilus assembly protein PilV